MIPNGQNGQNGPNGQHGLIGPNGQNGPISPCCPNGPLGQAPTALAAWRSLLLVMGQPAWLVCAQRAVVLAVNAEALALLGHSEADLLDQAADGLIATPEDMAFWDDARRFANLAAAPTPLQSDTVLLDARGQLVHVSRSIRRLSAQHGQTDAPPYLVMLQDRSAAAQELQERDLLVAELQATLESTADGILVTDLAGHIRAFNKRFAAIWGLPEHLLIEQQDAAVFDWMRHSVVDPLGYDRRLAAISDATPAEASERLLLQSGKVIERVTRPQHSRGRPCGRVWSFRDRTELEAASQRIETLSCTDALTGLCNRSQLALALATAIAQSQRRASPLALLVVDLDRFKQINDSLGQQRADALLLGCADRIKGVIRRGDVVARIGGDQFAVVMHDASADAAQTTAGRLLAAVSQTCSVDGLEFTLTCSIGIALHPQDGSDGEQLICHAESALRRAKQGGRACFRFHQARQDADMRQRMRLDHAMRQALASQRFRLHYQPQIGLQNGAVIGCEALIRWRDPDLGEISPGQFIPVAEETGLIIAIGDWVLGQAVQQAARWRADGLVMPVSINVSALQFQQGDFVDRVAAVLQQHRLPSSLLELELTESILVHDADEALARLSQLAGLGVRLAIDDFGTGYSSLAYLKRFPIQRLKIDRSFVKGVPGDDSDCAIVRAVVQMAQALGMKVIAEGVETEPQRAFLHRLGCDEFQGFLYAPALDAGSFEQRVLGGGPGGASGGSGVGGGVGGGMAGRQRRARPRLSLVVR